MEILRQVCRETGVKKSEIIGRWRDTHIVEARRMIAQLMNLHGYPKTRIARVLHRHHSTVYIYIDPTWRAKKHIRYRERRAADERPETGALSDQQPAPHHV